jgi:hypothetical protein
MDIKVKEIELKRIAAQPANAFIQKWHYSGKIVRNSQLHFGCFVGPRLMGAMSFGCSLDKRKIIGLVKGTGWNEFVELNRMAFHDDLPKNSESRCIAVALRLIKKFCPQIKWVLSFADATQCGDGAIYRASGFKLIGIKKNTDILRLPDGEVTHSFNLKPTINSKLYQKYGRGGEGSSALAKRIGAEKLDGFQIKYIYFLDKSKEKDLTVPVLPYSKIAEAGAQMYKGKKNASVV